MIGRDTFVHGRLCEERNNRVEEEFIKVEADPSSNGYESGLLLRIPSRQLFINFYKSASRVVE